MRLRRTAGGDTLADMPSTRRGAAAVLATRATRATLTTL